MSLSVIALSFLTLTANAEASHPLIRPPMMIKPTQAQMPLPLANVLKKKTTGLDFESSIVTNTAIKQAKDYVEYRRPGFPKQKAEAWVEACETSMTSREPNPFCRIEQERVMAQGGTAPFNAKLRAEKRSLAESFKDGDFTRAEARSYGEVVAALGSTGDVESVVLPMARRVSSMSKCVPGTVPAAMGYKLEELFPNKEIVELSKSLYRKGIECSGKDLAQATSAFRLGLILVWQKQYKEIDSLMRKVESVPEAQTFHARAKYWRYQAAVALNETAAKNDAKEALLRDHPLTFQNLAANGDDSSMMDRVLGRGTPSVFTRSLIRPDVNPVLRAAEALEKIGSPILAAEILDRSVSDIGTIESEVRLYSAALLHRMGYSLTKFKILSSLFQDEPQLVTASTMELFFPLSYIDIVKQKQKETDPLLFLSLMRQESAFNPEAMSGVGARGLMQLMPATARGVRRITKAQLFKPEINIEVGTKYFLKRLEDFGGDVELTLAAYNAGAGRVDQWKKRYPTDNKILFLDFIPFKETRDYVSAILRNYYWYVRLYNPESMSKVASGSTNSRLPMKVQSILAANAGDAARLRPVVAEARDATRAPASLAPVGN